MRLELHWSSVETLAAGTATRLAEKTLAVDVDELCVLLEADARLQRAHLDLAHPGELISAPQIDGNLWKMVTWAQANSLDVKSPPKRPGK